MSHTERSRVEDEDFESGVKDTGGGTVTVFSTVLCTVSVSVDTTAWVARQLKHNWTVNSGP